MYSRTGGGGITSREKWSVPEINENNKKVAGKKDRYCALLMANSVARKLRLEGPPKQLEYVVGGLVTQRGQMGEKRGGYSSTNYEFAQKLNQALSSFGGV